ncbi:MAG: Bax inhibitor-1/YccA family protein [Chloroflexi bacterium]|nr:Bax inhibitor-1/YccA family protein [Chloroflexota bacterium]
MSDQRFSNPYASRGRPASPSELGVRPDARLSSAFLSQAFLWMFIGLLVSAGVAYFVLQNEPLKAFAAGNFLILMIAQLGIVFGISLGINRMSATLALGLFFVYAASLGLTLGLIIGAYSGTAVVSAFVASATMFGAASVYGAVTKRSLAGLGGILFMGVIGLLVASVINIFLGSSGLSWIISIAGVVIFTALTAYDVQRIQNGDLAVRTGSMEKAAVIGALQLYLDFVNIFLFMLRLFGGSRN